MSLTLGGTNPAVTFPDGTVQNTSANLTAPYTANGVVYASSTSALATGSGLTFNGSTLSVSGAQFQVTNTTASSYSDYNNTGGDFYVGLDNSAGTGIGTGTAYAASFVRTGAYPFIWKNNGSVNMTLDTSGNLGLGVTPSAWGSSYRTLAISTESNFYASTNQCGITLNAYNDNTNWRYATSDYATRYLQYQGVHYWNIAGSGTAGNAISFIQAMTLDNSGNLLVGATSTVSSAKGYVNCASGSNGWTTQVANNGNLLFNGIGSSGSSTFYVAGTGQIYSTSIAITAISDQRLKENVRDIDTGLDAILALKPRRFDWKEGKGQDKKNVAGFIAQEFETVFPECVSTSLAGEDGIEYKNINHETLIPTLVKAIQEQQAIIEQLKQKVGI
jgi:hypothetical protein